MADDTPLIIDSDKQERFVAVSEAVVRCLLHTGPQGFRYAAVARSAGVSRAWLYKYFGKDPQVLLHFVARQFGDEFTDLDRPIATTDSAAWREAVLAYTRRGFDEVVARPWMMELYFRYRHDRGVLGDAIGEIRRRHLDKFVAEMPAHRRSRPFATAFASMRLGLYFDWIDPNFRANVPLDRAMAPLEAMLR